MPSQFRIAPRLMISTLWLCVIIEWGYASTVPNTTTSNKVGKFNLSNPNNALLLNVAELRNELSHIFDTNRFSAKIKQLIPDRPRPPRTFIPHLGALFSFQNSPSLSLNYELANRFCTAKGAYLFFPSDSAELELLKSKFDSDEKVWIDLRRNSNFSFSLMDGKPAPAGYKANLIDYSSINNTQCLAFSPYINDTTNQFHLFQTDCSRTLQFACKLDSHAFITNFALYRKRVDLINFLIDWNKDLLRRHSNPISMLDRILPGLPISNCSMQNASSFFDLHAPLLTLTPDSFEHNAWIIQGYLSKIPPFLNSVRLLLASALSGRSNVTQTKSGDLCFLNASEILRHSDLFGDLFSLDGILALCTVILCAVGVINVMIACVLCHHNTSSRSSTPVARVKYVATPANAPNSLSVYFPDDYTPERMYRINLQDVVDKSHSNLSSIISDNLPVDTLFDCCK